MMIELGCALAGSAVTHFLMRAVFGYVTQAHFQAERAAHRVTRTANRDLEDQIRGLEEKISTVTIVREAALKDVDSLSKRVIKAERELQFEQKVMSASGLFIKVKNEASEGDPERWSVHCQKCGRQLKSRMGGEKAVICEPHDCRHLLDI